MAKEEKKPKENKKENEKSGGLMTRLKSMLGIRLAGMPLVTWLIVLVVVMVGTTGGFALAQLIAGPPATVDVNPENAEQSKEKTFEEILAESQEEKKVWHYSLDPIVANLDEPGVTRYVRVTITLEMSPEMSFMHGEEFINEKKLLLRDWLTTYLAGLTLEQVRGNRNLTRIKKEIRDNYNEILFPESKPFVNRVLIKEFAVQ